MFLRNSQEASYQNWRTWENLSLLLPWMWFGPQIRNIHSFFTKLYMQTCGTMLSLITFMPYWIALLAELAFVYNLYLALGLSMGISACRLLMIIQVSLCGYQWSFFRCNHCILLQLMTGKNYGAFIFNNHVFIYHFFLLTKILRLS